VQYRYDHRGLLVEIPTYATFVYDDATYKPTRTTFANGATEIRRYDPARQWLAEISLATQQPEFREVVTRDALGRVRTAKTERSQVVTTQYGYDDLGRLRRVRSTDPTFDADHQYDGTGNLILDSQRGTIAHADPAHPHAPTDTASGQKFVYDAVGQLVRSDRLRVTWDADQNPIEVEDVVAATTTTNRFDAAQRMTWT
jgi:YD repeat-containing protein